MSSITFSRPPAADCRGGKAGDACTTNRKMGESTEGLGALAKRRLNTPQKENIPQSADVGDSEDIVVETERREYRSYWLACKILQDSSC